MSSLALPLSAQLSDADRRRATREDVALDIVMANREGETFAARLLNLSTDGFMAETEAPLCERAPIRVDVPTIGWVRADIVWVLGDRIGASFREPLAPHAFATFVSVFGERPRG